MALTRPISDLNSKAEEIAELAHSSGEPVFITKDGEGDLVVTSMALYGKMQLKLELFGKLAAAQAQRAGGDAGRNLSRVMTNLRKHLHTES